MTLRDIPLRDFFHPRVVAVIGASGRSGSGPRLLYKTVKKKVEAEGGVVLPVNPTRTELDGDHCYASIHEIEGHVDLAVIAGGDPIEMLRDVAAKRPTFAMLFSAGFAESGDTGRELQSELEKIVAESGIYLLGPNTTLNSFLPLRDDLPGRKVALISHSGNQGRHLWEGQEIGIPFAGWAPTGNEVDLEFADFARYFADQDDVGAIAAYIEGFKSGETLIEVAEYAAERRVPIIMVKVGRSDIGAAAAMSHTAHLAGADAVADGVFKQHGIVRVNTLDELLHVSGMLARSEPPSATGVCIYGISGGTTAHLTDLAVASGLSLPELSAETQERLGALIPDYLRISNPVDSGGAPTGDARGRQILETLVEDPSVGVIVCPFAANPYHLGDRLAQDIVEVARHTKKPMCVVWGSPLSDAPAYRDVLVPSGLPVFRTFDQCLTSLKAYFSYHAFLESRRDREEGYVRPVDPGRVVDLPMLPRGARSEAESKKALRAIGIETPRERVVCDAASAVAAADAIGYPVALKINSAAIAHKAQYDLVRLSVSGPEEVRAQFEELCARFRQLGAGGFEGITVSEMITGGLEVVVGAVRDSVFGSAVMFGLGGALLELVRDVAFRVPPFGRREALRMIEETSGQWLLRRVKPQAIDSVVNAIMAVQDLMLVAGDRVAEVDINPLIVLADRAIAVDALLVTQ